MIIETEVFLPGKLPNNWHMLTRCRDGAAFVRDDGLVVITNGVKDANGDRWLHVSCSCEACPPTLTELQVVKRLFVGEQQVALQVIPPAVTPHNRPNCFHIWASLDGKPFPSILTEKEKVQITQAPLGASPQPEANP